MRILKAALLVLVIGVSGTASAQLKTVKVDLPAGNTNRTLKFASAEPAILGIKLGDSVDSVIKILEKEFGPESIQVSHEDMSTVVNGVARVFSNTFLSGYSASKKDKSQSDTIHITLSSPMTGSRVIEVQRTLVLRGANLSELPDYGAVKDAVLNNYGPSTKVYFNNDGLQWQYMESNGQLAVRQDMCIGINGSCTLFDVGPLQLDDLARYTKAGVNVIVSAKIYGAGAGKAERVTVEMKDVAGALESHLAVLDLLTEKGKESLKATEGAAPKIVF